MFSKHFAQFHSRDIAMVVLIPLAILLSATLFGESPSRWSRAGLDTVQQSRQVTDCPPGQEPPGQGCCPHHGPPPPPPPPGGVPPTVLFLIGGALGYLIGSKRPPCGPPHHRPRPPEGPAGS